MNRVVAVVLAPALAVVLALGTALFVGAAGQNAAGVCGDPGAALVNAANLPERVGEFAGEQLVIAATILNVGHQQGMSRRAQTIAVMAAMGESSLRNLSRGDAVRADTIGVFQIGGEHGSWDDRMDPAWSAGNFYDRLTKVPGFETLAPTIAAHKAQRNADPYHYEKWWNPAVALVNELAGTGSNTLAVDLDAVREQYGLGPVQAVTARAVADIAPRFDYSSVGGWREDPNFPDHPSGLAADFMVPLTDAGREKGDNLAQWLIDHHAQYEIEYLLWQQSSWRPDRGWKPMSDRGSATANHRDHVHVTFLGDKTGTGAISAACIPGEAGYFAAGDRVMPAATRITSRFGMRFHPIHQTYRLHRGIDFDGPCGTPIRAAASGVVIYSGPSPGLGNRIEIDHGSQSVTRYGHMYSHGMFVTAGQHVTVGQVIAEIGNTGTSTACHLHFEVHINGEAIDPEPWLAATQ